MNYTSINISNKDHKFKYIIEYNDNEEYVNNIYSYTIDQDTINFFEDGKKRYFKNNSIVSSSIDGGTKQYNPEFINLSSINLYIPEYSLNVYHNGVKYILTVNTWVNNSIVYLGTYIFGSSDIKAADKVRTFYNNKYYEKVSVKFIDPWFLNYDDAWKDWRVNICDSKIVEGFELNNNGSVLNFTLHPVIDIDGQYFLFDEYVGGQNSINLKDETVNKLKYCISTDFISTGICFDGEITFNETYEQSFDGLKEYFRETYNIDNFNIRYEFYIQDQTDLYDYFVIDKNSLTCRLSKPMINRNGSEIQKYISWDEYFDGLYINSTCNIFDENGELIMSIMSNEIPLTKEIYKYFIYSKENDLNLIKLNLIDMNVYNINAVNKIQQNIIQIDRPKDYKSNIIKPVYYRVRDLANLVIHPTITENVCLNLDKYKYLVDAFILRIEGVNFVEYSRNPNGVVFKVVGNKLPNSSTSGTYYILNQDNELISTGKYTYEV